MSAVLETPKMAVARTLKGDGTDQELLEVINRRPGLSKYGLARTLKWSIGKTDGAIIRLVKRRLVYLMSLEREGRQVNLIYPADYVEPDFISIPGDIRPKTAKSVRVLALDSANIGVRWDDEGDWDEISFQTKNVPIEEIDGEATFRLPEDFKRFYGYSHKQHVVSIIRNALLITVSGELRKV